MIINSQGLFPLCLPIWLACLTCRPYLLKFCFMHVSEISITTSLTAPFTKQSLRWWTWKTCVQWTITLVERYQALALFLTSGACKFQCLILLSDLQTSWRQFVHWNYFNYVESNSWFVSNYLRLFAILRLGILRGINWQARCFQNFFKAHLSCATCMFFWSVLDIQVV